MKVLKHIFLFWLFLAMLGYTAFSQTLELPRASPNCEVKQRVGLTDVKVRYCRPSVKGRKIWGHLVPYDVLWRTGANEATLIHFTEPVKVAGKEVPAGTYSIFTVPVKTGEWTFKLNRDTTLFGTNNYDEKKDVIHCSVKAEKGFFTESLTIGFSDVTISSANLYVAWEEKFFRVPIQVDVEKKALENVLVAVKNNPNDWSILTKGAEYCISIKKNLDNAKIWLDKAVELNQKSFYPRWQLAELAAYQKNYALAVQLAKLALQLGIEEQGDKFTYKKRLEKSIVEWEEKAPK